MKVPCFECKGHGFVSNYACFICGGKGKLDTDIVCNCGRPGIRQAGAEIVCASLECYNRAIKPVETGPTYDNLTDEERSWLSMGYN
jgi:RecJ-like exonuclease